MIKRVSYGFLCLDKENRAISTFIEINDLEIDTMWLQKSFNNDLESTIEQILDKNVNVKKLFVLDTNLTNRSVMLAIELLKMAVDVCIVCEDVQNLDMLRLFRVFHCGGLCISLEDLKDEFQR